MDSEQPKIKIPRLRQDLKLYPGPRHRDGSPSWRILDPVRNRFFEIGWLEFELLSRFSDEEDVDSLIARVSTETAIKPTMEEVAAFIKFLSDHQLVSPEGREALGRLRMLWMKADRSWYERLFHGYLFFRIPLFRPDRFLAKTLPVVELLFTREFAAAVLLVFLADLYLLTREWEELRRTFVYFLSLQGGLLFLIAATFSKVFHEFGHAYTAKRYGVRVPVMGIAFLVMWPFLYTDTGDTWKLSDQKKQLRISSAGMVAELVLAIFATLFWAISPEGAAKYMLFILATTTWIMTLAINASPFMRFDGYFVLSDALGFPNLHERSFACARWWIRRTFFKLPEPLPEPSFTAKQRAGLVAFAIIVWTYRLVVFLGIALLVYHMFIKLLGILLMALELVWFIIRPIWSEVRYLWSQRSLAHIAWSPFAALFVLLIALAWMLPIANQVTAPAVMRADNEQLVFAPFAAKLVAVEVRSGQTVEPNQVLFRLDVPELTVRESKAAASLAAARIEFARAAASERQRDRQSVLLEQIGGALAEEQSVKEDAERLVIRSNGRAVVRDVPPEVVPGRWVNPRQLLARLVSTSSATIEAYVVEARIKSVEVGQEVTFIPHSIRASTVKGRIRSIDTVASRRIPRYVLLSPYGGEIPSVVDRRGGATAQDPYYRVLVEAEPGQYPATLVMPGTLRVKINLEILAENFIFRALSLLIRETAI